MKGRGTYSRLARMRIPYIVDPKSFPTSCNAYDGLDYQKLYRNPVYNYSNKGDGTVANASEREQK
jgi:hypothetical protein